MIRTSLIMNYLRTEQVNLFLYVPTLFLRNHHGGSRSLRMSPSIILIGDMHRLRSNAKKPQWKCTRRKDSQLLLCVHHIHMIKLKYLYSAGTLHLTDSGRERKLLSMETAHLYGRLRIIKILQRGLWGY